MGMTATAELDRDYAVLTDGCGLLDRSERGKLALTGEDRKEFLNGQVTNEVEALADGEGCYAAFLTPKGKMLGDLRILDAGEELLLDTARVALQPLFDLLRRYSLGHRVELHKRTVERGLLSLVGPRAREVAGAGALPQASTPTPPPSWPAARYGSSSPTSGSISSAMQRRPRRSPPPRARRGAGGAVREAPR